MQRYKQLLFFAGKLTPMPEEEQVPENKVEGCVSQVKHVIDKVHVSLYCCLGH